MLLGAHMSIAGGLYKAFERGAVVGCQAMQVFTKSERQWKAKPILEADLAAWKKAKASSTIGTVITHDSYLINLGNPTAEKWEKSLEAFQEEIDRNITLEIPYLVTHAGSHMGSGEEACIKQIAKAVNQIHSNYTTMPGTMILFETTAGQGTAIGYKFEHWAMLLEQLDHPDWTGICFDTCHVFASGYDLSTAEGYADTMAKFDSLIGLHKIKAFHLNDSKQGLGCRVDRHEGIGKGAIGIEGFRCLMNDPHFTNIPMVIETPKIKDDDPAEDIVNLATLRGLIKN